MGRAYDDLAANLKMTTAKFAPARSSEQIPPAYTTGVWAQINYAPDSYRASVRQIQGHREL